MARPTHRTLAIVTAVLLPALAWGWHERAQRIEAQDTASTAATQIAGRPVRVLCPGILKRTFLHEINHGSVRFYDGKPVNDAHLSGTVCAGLRRLISDGPALDLACLQLDTCSKDDTRVALGVAVLTHESVHLRGVMDEAATECEAVRRSASVARLLGASPQAAAYIADWQFSVADDNLPQQYQSAGDCRFGSS